MFVKLVEMCDGYGAFISLCILNSEVYFHLAFSAGLFNCFSLIIIIKMTVFGNVIKWQCYDFFLSFFLFTDLVICFWQVRQWVGVYGRQQDEATGTVKPVFVSPIPSQHDICCVITTPF